MFGMLNGAWAAATVLMPLLAGALEQSSGARAGYLAVIIPSCALAAWLVAGAAGGDSGGRGRAPTAPQVVARRRLGRPLSGRISDGHRARQSLDAYWRLFSLSRSSLPRNACLDMSGLYRLAGGTFPRASAMARM